MKLKDNYLGLVEHQVKEWQVELDTLRQRVDKGESSTRDDHYKKLDNLQAKHHLAETNLEDLKAASEESWEDLKIGYEKIRKEMQESIANVKTTIK